MRALFSNYCLSDCDLSPGPGAAHTPRQADTAIRNCDQDEKLLHLKNIHTFTNNEHEQVSLLNIVASFEVQVQDRKQNFYCVNTKQIKIITACHTKHTLSLSVMDCITAGL